MSIRILLQNDLDSNGLTKALDKTIAQLAAGDFQSAEVKKMAGKNLFRAKLNYRDRLLFTLGRFQSQQVMLVLEVIRNHQYEKSRFLRGARIDESDFSPIDSPAAIEQQEPVDLAYLHPESNRFYFLDKILSFDDQQDAVLNQHPPLIIIGSAGSGKTTLTLEKLKQLRGDVLYTTLSPFLAQNARDLYHSHYFSNAQQDVSFLSFRELLETIEVPRSRELRFRDFEKWFFQQRGSTRIRDVHKLYEEINGVLTGGIVNKEFLSRKEYLDLGIRQSIFTPEERSEVYNQFERYLRMLDKEGFYDPNILAQQYISQAEPEYDFIVVDEIQDLTNTQLNLILRFLRGWDQFILCGDSNQIVHPNFFSWSALKSMFYQERLDRKTQPKEITRILFNNYRNSRAITDLANRLLLIKNARFGSIDRESNYLVECTSEEEGAIELIRARESVLHEVNKRTGRSAQTAVLVPRNEDKEAARKFFKTPLLFSIQEAKGLEYPNIVLFNFVSGYREEFNAIIEGVEAGKIKGELKYARAKDKRDKSLEQYKFFINSLYVALTRAVQNLYILEQDTGHPLFGLLELRTVLDKTSARTESSSSEDWKREARRLEAQGKDEQAEAIRREILGRREVEWKVYTTENFGELKAEALDDKKYNKKSKQLLYEFADTYCLPGIVSALDEKKFHRPLPEGRISADVLRKTSVDYFGKPNKEILRKIEKYGPNFRNPLNQTPLMIAARIGDVDLISQLLEAGADREEIDNSGMTPLRIALAESITNDQYQQFRLDEIYPLLAPSCEKIRVNNRMIKLDSSSMEFFLLQFMLAHWSLAIRMWRYSETTYVSRWFFTASMLQSFLGLMPETVLSENRKKRPYLSAMLSKNEIYGNSPYNRRIFVRVQRGFYFLNPCMDLAVKDDWVNIMNLIQLPFLTAESEVACVGILEKSVGMLKDAVRNDRSLHDYTKRVSKMAWAYLNGVENPEDDSSEAYKQWEMDQRIAEEEKIRRILDESLGTEEKSRAEIAEIKKMTQALHQRERRLRMKENARAEGTEEADMMQTEFDFGLD
jgi:hypothetical protein